MATKLWRYQIRVFPTFDLATIEFWLNEQGRAEWECYFVSPDQRTYHLRQLYSVGY